MSAAADGAPPGDGTDDRSAVATAHRVVVKVGSSSLTTPTGGIDPERIGALVDALVAVRLSGREVVLVSSGAIAAGLAPLGMKTRPRDLANQQAAASVGQSLLMEHYGRLFARAGLGVGQVLLTVDDVTRRGNYRNAFRTFGRLLELGVVPVVNENDTVATQEIRFGDNDRLAALVAHLVHADALVLLSDVDALWTAHPATPGAERISRVASAAELADVDVTRRGSAVGTGGMQTKIEAAGIATSAGIPVVLTSAPHAGEALAGAEVGTLFAPTGKRRPTRLLWLRHASETKGRLVLDAGAVRAVVQRKASLLPAGVTGVEGTFTAGEPVDLVGPDDVVVARGLVAYDSEELPALLGRTTQDLTAELGSGYERTVVHRDALVVLSD
ncbi:glutamate 5-kinase [Microlunatus sagamiharensis]|uniref:Glutamate 5-kinase n=1 Tax=Microlunatus sagamiharensis TaxID=546874 RepID=A0A1H2LQE9_9ACTN|nr:glutamate 5-kinase [Microlunatus sagamiharensis]SDU83159.1 glutamate 5-kinase [Microlunatus sagamiharensis]